jgi:hypothetical protein
METASCMQDIGNRLESGCTGNPLDNKQLFTSHRVRFYAFSFAICASGSLLAVKQTTHLQLVPRSRRRASVHSLPTHIFMEYHLSTETKLSRMPSDIQF